MNMTVARRGIDYILKACVMGSTAPEQIPYYPQKTRSMMSQTPRTMPRMTSPESMGIPSARVEAFLHALEKDRGSRMHNLLIYCKGRLISHASAPGYSPLVWSLTHSMAKTITALALSTLVEDGLVTLDTRLVDIFKGEVPTFISSRTQKITIRHLLTMTAGVVNISETAAVTIEDWKREFFSCTPTYVPGTRFHYNSINSYMLAAVVEKLTRRPLEEVLKERIFDPLEITQYYIEKSAQGIAKGGWGMYLTPVDMAKLGMLVLNGGKWHGKVVIQEHHIQEALSIITETPLACGDYNYGLHLWVARDGSAALFNGMLGQNVWVHFKNQIVVVSTCGNDEFFQQSSTLKLIQEYFGNDLTTEKPLMTNLLAQNRLRRAEQDFFCGRFQLPRRGQHEDCYSRKRDLPLPKQVDEILGTYVLEKNNVGLLPLVLRLMQNNHSAGVSQVAFEKRDKRFFMHWWEGETEYVLEGGFGAFRYQELNFKGEKYMVGMMCAFVTNEDGEELFKCEVIVPEIPNSRRIKCYFHDGGGLVINLSETPGIDMLYMGLKSLSEANHISPYVATFVQKQMNSTLITSQILHCLEPVLYAHKEERALDCGECPERAAIVRQRTVDHRARGKK